MCNRAFFYLVDFTKQHKYIHGCKENSKYQVNYYDSLPHQHFDHVKFVNFQQQIKIHKQASGNSRTRARAHSVNANCGLCE